MLTRESELRRIALRRKANYVTIRKPPKLTYTKVRSILREALKSDRGDIIVNSKLLDRAAHRLFDAIEESVE